MLLCGRAEPKMCGTLIYSPGTELIYVDIGKDGTKCTFQWNSVHMNLQVVITLLSMYKGF